MNFKKYFYDTEYIVEAVEIDDIPEMITIEKKHYEYGCPFCKAEMREKDYSFKYNAENNTYTHSCCDKPFKMPKQDYGGLLFERAETPSSGFEKEETDPVSPADQKKVDAILKNKNLPDIAEDGKAYIVKWADGRGIFACNSKKYISEWLQKTGGWACIDSITYGEPKIKNKKLKVLKEKEVINEKKKKKLRPKYKRVRGGWIIGGYGYSGGSTETGDGGGDGGGG